MKHAFNFLAVLMCTIAVCSMVITPFYDVANAEVAAAEEEAADSEATEDDAASGAPAAAGSEWSEQSSGFDPGSQQINNAPFYRSQCDPSDSSSSEASGTPGDLSKTYVVGDSITVGGVTAGDYEKKLKDAGAKDVKIAAVAGSNLYSPGAGGEYGGTDPGREKKPGLDYIKDDQSYIKDATTVIVAHGTNNLKNGLDPSDEAAGKAVIKEVIDEIKKSGTKAKIYWVDIAVTQGGVDKASGAYPGSYQPIADHMNKLLYSNTSLGYSMLSWAKAVDPEVDPATQDKPLKDPKGLLSSDELHPGDYNKYTDAIIAALKKGGEAGGSSSTSSPDSSSSSASQCCGDNTTSTSGTIKSTVDGGGCGDKGYSSGTRSDANKDQIWSFLIGNGLSEEAAAGVMGNMYRESGFMPDADNGNSAADNGGSGCRGVVQWCGGRNVELTNFAKERNKDWDCLGLQLEFMWYEVTETKSASQTSDGNNLPEGVTLWDTMTSKKDAPNQKEYYPDGKATPGGAANMFHDYFERANKNAGEHLGRAESAEEIYKEFTGKAAGSLGDSSSSGATCSKEVASGELMAPECEALVKRYKELREKKAITETVPDMIDDDLSKCKKGEHTCNEGVSPYLLRAVVGVAENSGDEAIEVWNMNARHPCDGLNHPKGFASDLFCFDNNSRGQSGGSVNNGGQGPSKEKCNRMFKFLYENYDDVQLSELIWNAPTDFSKPGDGKQLYVDGHHDHIHIGIREEKGDQNN